MNETSLIINTSNDSITRFKVFIICISVVFAAVPQIVIMIISYTYNGNILSSF